jgi:hypothetical protein
MGTARRDKADPGKRLASELAGAAGIKQEEAARVLDCLGLPGLLEDVDAVNRVIANDSARQGLGLAHLSELGAVGLGHLRVGIKGSDFGFVDVVA